MVKDRDILFRWDGETIDTGDPTFIVKTVNDSVIYGVWCPREKKIYVHIVESRRKGDFKKMMDYLTRRFNTSKVVFTNIISIALLKKLRKKKVFVEEFMGEPMLCAEVEWER